MSFPPFHVLALFSEAGRRKMSAEFLRLGWKAAETPYHAMTTTLVRPETVTDERYGHVRSLAAEGLRFWMFEEETGRDLFLAEHAEYVRQPAGATP